jgi:hypothetical protein
MDTQDVGASIMRTTASSNGLDMAAIHPSKSPRYSPNLYQWLNTRGRTYRTYTSRVYLRSDGKLYIGDKDEYFLSGSLLMAVLCNGSKETGFAYGFVNELTEVEDFWERYTKDGRCAIDTEHSMHFINDESRWLREGDKRTCQWCGNHTQTLRRWTETVKKSAWIVEGANKS